jgi:bifunctional NMN adenylyltransferase/nudix hydrolase
MLIVTGLLVRPSEELEDIMDIGVVIGRFQVETLHEGHRYLINEAFRNHKKVIIFIGCSPIQGTKYDPLDFPTRERMLRMEYPDAIIMPVHDHLSDEVWSKRLDDAIKGIVPNLKGARIYGGRDSFKPHYKGKFTAVEVESGIQYMNGREQRDAIGRVVRSSSDFRAGIIYATQNSWPYTKMCVDMGCVRKYDKDSKLLPEPMILLGRKESENKWRLPGGGVDKGETLEQAVRREFSEETGLGLEGPINYVGSFPVGDWRYKNAGEIGILTALFVSEFSWGAPRAGDDLIELKWCPISKAEKEVVKSHKALVAAVRRHINE